MTVQEKLPANGLKEREVLMSLMYWKMDIMMMINGKPNKVMHACMTTMESSLYPKYSSIF